MTTTGDIEIQNITTTADIEIQNMTTIGDIEIQNITTVNSSSILSGSNIIAFADDNCSISTEEGPNPSFTIS
jgi:hypothetical protein